MALNVRKEMDAAWYAQAIASQQVKQTSPYVVVNAGTATLAAGTVTVTTGDAGAIAGLTTDYRVFLSYRTAPSGAASLSAPTASFTATQFVINSTLGTDTAVVCWELLAPMYHRDVTSSTSGSFDNPVAAALVATAATAVDLPTSITLTQNLMGVYNSHIADNVAHIVADTTNVLANTVASVTALASVITALNDLKAKFNAHLSQAGVHVINDGINTVAAANASDQGTSNTLANAIKTSLNAHIQRGVGPAGSAVAFVNP